MAHVSVEIRNTPQRINLENQVNNSVCISMGTQLLIAIIGV